MIAHPTRPYGIGRDDPRRNRERHLEPVDSRKVDKFAPTGLPACEDEAA